MLKEIAQKLNGTQYPTEPPLDIQAMAKENQIVIAFGASDDLLEMRGAVDEEWGACNGTTVHVDHLGVIEDPMDPDDTDQPRLSAAKHYVKAEWDPVDDIVSWRLSTDLHYEVFNIMEGEEIYCRGIVFRLPGVPG